MLKTNITIPLPVKLTPYTKFQRGVEVRLDAPADGHIDRGVLAGAIGIIHAGPADEGTGLVRVWFDKGEFWCDPDSLTILGDS